MAVPVDGIVMQATQLSVDEAAMTGESDEMKKEILRFALTDLLTSKARPAMMVVTP